MDGTALQSEIKNPKSEIITQVENTGFLKIVIIILLIINIATLSFMWLHKGPMGMPPPPHDHGNAFGFLTHELNLTRGQQEQYEQLRDDHHHSMERLQEHGRELRHRFFNFHGVAADSSVALQWADSIAMNQKQIELTTFQHFRKVRGLCTPEQQKKFDVVIDEALRMMAPKPPAR